MTLRTLIGSVLCLSFGVLAQNENTPVLACNTKAISAAQRPRYNELLKRLRSAVRSNSELPDGYVLRLDGKAISLVEIAEWMSMERLCCPFLRLHLSATGNDAEWQLGLSGPPGAKAILQAVFASAR